MFRVRSERALTFMINTKSQDNIPNAQSWFTKLKKDGTDENLTKARENEGSKIQ